MSVLVIGGGQLARMMAQIAPSLGIRLKVLADSQETSIMGVAEVFEGDFRDLNSVRAAAEGMQVITFDHEHVPMEVLTQLEELGAVVRPSASALRFVQNKLYLREMLDSWGVEQPKWRGGTGSPTEIVSDFFSTGGDWPVVLKSAVGGYDGRGVWVLRDKNDLAQQQRAFELMGTSNGSATAPETQQWLVEEFCEFERELSAQVARTPHGQGLAYQVVETRQREGICRQVIAPAPQLSEGLAIAAQRIGLQIAEKTGAFGMLAVELFLMPDSRLLVNELAMRPHNSGHWTIDGAVTSQFENHLRGVLNLPLGSVRALWPCTVMANVIGETQVGPETIEHLMAHDPGLKIHLYGKGFRVGRKLGHVTAGDDSQASALARATYGAARLSGTN